MAVNAAGLAAKAGCTGFTSHRDIQDMSVQVGECTLNGSTLHIMLFNSQSDQQMYVMIAKADPVSTTGQGSLWVMYGSDPTAVEQATAAAGGSVLESAPVAPGGGATALCNDGTYSFAADHQGACSHHGGVQVFYK
jgi:hypothetical protein